MLRKNENVAGSRISTGPHLFCAISPGYYMQPVVAIAANIVWSGFNKAQRRHGNISMLSFISRLILVPTGFIMACLASLFVLVTLGAERVTHALQGTEDITITGNLEILSHSIALVSAATVVPALLVVIVGEIARLRSMIYYIAGAGIALAMIPLIAQLSYAADLSMPDSTVWPIFATAGFLGGFTYWITAGRNA